MLNRLVMVVFVFILSGCSELKLEPIKYNGSVIQKSNLIASVKVNTGKVTGYSGTTMIYAGGFFMPITSGPTPALQFAEEDQNTFIQSLKAELLRHKIVNKITEGNANNQLQIIVNFVQTEHFPNLQEYKITVLMLLKSGNKKTHKKYAILSSKGDSTWTKLNTNALQGKTKAATKLMNAIIPDIEKFIATLPK